jgi:putative hemolysin
MVLSPALRLVRRLAGERNGAKAEPPPTDEEQLEELLREGELEGVGEAGEIAIISGVVQFGEKRVRDVMVSRGEVFALPQDMPAAEMAGRVAQSGYSRVPLYRESLDNRGDGHGFDLLRTRDRGAGAEAGRLPEWGIVQGTSLRHAAGTAAHGDRSR